MALLAHITTDEDTAPIERLCRDFGVEDVTMLSGREINDPGTYLVLLNGLILGAHNIPNELVRMLRSMRRKGLAGEFVSFYKNEGVLFFISFFALNSLRFASDTHNFYFVPFLKGQKVVHIATDGGRICRPVIIVDEKTALPRLTQAHIEGLVVGTISIKDLLRQEVVEYIDVNEENNCLIAVTERELDLARKNGLKDDKMPFTHLEIDPMSLLGVVAGLIPYPHHNQSPRNTYQVRF